MNTDAEREHEPTREPKAERTSRPGELEQRDAEQPDDARIKTNVKAGWWLVWSGGW